MALATATSDGATSNRIVSAKGIDDSGVVFGTDARSAKGADLDANPYAACTFYWRETAQQLHLRGPVERLNDSSADALFAGRPRAAQAASLVTTPRRTTP